MRRGFVVAAGTGFMVLSVALFFAVRGPDLNAVPTAEEVSDRTMSPFCPGLTLSECPSSQSATLRDQIEDKVASGWTNRRLDTWLTQNYGEGVLARPRGFIAYLLPGAILLAGFGVLITASLRWSRGARSPDVAARALSDDDRRLIAAELETFAGGTE